MPCDLQGHVLRRKRLPWKTRGALPGEPVHEWENPAVNRRDRSSRGPLGDFLAARRASLSAPEAGLAETGKLRRVPGLRREEVAHLAGISTDYYTRLEQGRVRTASRAVLNALGRALQLNGDQHRYLIQLAHPEASDRSGCRHGHERIRPQIARLLSNLVDTAGLVLGPYLDILAWNRLASALFGDLHTIKPQHRNLARMVFLDPHTRSLLLDWRERAQETVSTLRMAAGTHPLQPRLRALISELAAHDGDFRTWWGQHLVTMRTCGRSRLNHPIAGQFDVDWQFLTDVEDEKLWVVLLSAPAGTSAHAALRNLDAVAEERGLQEGAWCGREPHGCRATVGSPNRAGAKASSAIAECADDGAHSEE
ncbi:helix-turn-helix transcriptional regulator [Nonomuraea sp. NPDC004580]|uniref:helix-turn-helix transcriptional regulator n=1 Tax=Nonomuraea sp. NPDC004580 TaxID=3154552 RepID=UPI0033AAAA6E